MIHQQSFNQTSNQFIISPKTFNLALGLIGSDLKYIVDKSILELEGYLYIQSIVVDSQTGIQSMQTQQVPFQLEVCTNDNMQNEQLQQQFQQYTSNGFYFCLPQNMQFQVEGEYGASVYSSIVLNLKKCNGSSCKSEQIIDQALQQLKVEVFFSDVVISPLNKDSPLQFYVNNFSWEASETLPKKVYLELIQNRIQTDIGFLVENLVIEEYPSLSQARETVTTQQNGLLSSLVLQFQGNKQNNYQRSYQSVIQIISELGGFSQFLTLIGFLMVNYYSSLKLNCDLINSVFQLKEIKQNSQANSINQNQLKGKSANVYTKRMSLFQQQRQKQYQQNSRKSLNMNINDLPTQSVNTDSFVKENIKDKQSEQSINQIELFQNKRLVSIKDQSQLKSKQSEIKTSDERNRSESNFTQLKRILGSIKGLATQNSLFKSKENDLTNSTIHSKENKKSKNDEQSSSEINKFKKLNQKLDVTILLSKIFEIEKLKAILLDDDQLNLFQYLPKPQICYSFNQKEEIQFHNNNNFVFDINSRNNDNNENSDKLQKAIKSYQKITSKADLFKIDHRIIKNLDPSYKKIFQNATSQQKIENATQQLQSYENNRPARIQPEKFSEAIKEVEECQEYFVTNDFEENKIEENFKNYKSLSIQKPSPNLTIIQNNDCINQITFQDINTSYIISQTNN
ncbi:hypothetical protein TTHERM_00227480 (macronuclear) [Tetrahymena thermophila SB210]|uniref:Uncharacterized protein n=1 Tax=Tetrahymena thermophila (strain SB210) TaxID=312017 RepID=Q23BT4_TETTS|nr:hypothetical protein TTHERM_00227480 [Tetrahymena thermophila SB210]EAR94034.2 hypothetical protein TTHERM_00227480 [Tetrahymena thermophila SB210]|eukprot:XP_001014279.2 hypothetical protein TTHERM_00227480 [Tetrahymena thermophila SB210]